MNYLKAYHFINDYKKGEIKNLDKKINIIYRNNNKVIKKEDLINIRDECNKTGNKLYVSNNFKNIPLSAPGEVDCSFIFSKSII